jgi:hypothetical protein
MALGWRVVRRPVAAGPVVSILQGRRLDAASISMIEKPGTGAMRRDRGVPRPQREQGQTRTMTTNHYYYYNAT